MRNLAIPVLQSCERARSEERRGNYEAARELLGGFGLLAQPDTEGLAQGAGAELKLRQGSITSVLGAAYGEPQAQEHARDLLTSAQEAFFALGNLRRCAECFTGIAMSYWREGRTREALAYIAASLECTAEISGEERAISLINRAIIYKATGQPESALDDLRTVAPLVNLLQSDYVSGIYHQTLGNINKALGAREQRPELFDVAITHNRKAAAHFERCGHLPYQTRTETTLGNLYRVTGHFVEAERHLLHARDTARRLKDKSLEGQVEESLARLYEEQGRLIEAERSARRSVRRHEETGERLLLAESYETLARILRKDSTGT